MHPLLRKLEGGDLRSIGRSEEVVTEVLNHPELFKTLIEGMNLENPVVRMRAADAMEKVSRTSPEYLLPFKQQFFALAAKSKQKEVRWHIAQILLRLNLTDTEKAKVVDTLLEYLSGNSSIVNTCVMQGLADIAKTDENLRPSLLLQIKELTTTGTPAMQARGRKLLAEFKGQDTSAITEDTEKQE